MKIADLIISPASLGNKFWLTGITPAYAYQDNRRTDTVTGFKYAVCLPEKGLEKINVKIDGKKLLDAPESGYAEVRFENLEVYVYWSRGDYAVGARATNVIPVNSKA